MNTSDLSEVLRRHTPALMSIPGVTGTGEGKRGERAVFVVYVDRGTPELKRRIPREVEGFPVEVREVGKVTAPPP